MRAALAVVLVLLAAPTTAAAAPAFLEPDARIFTLAGGGSEPPRDGLDATRADLGSGTLRGLGALPDGSVAVLTDAPQALAVGVDGRIRMLPRPPRSARLLAVGPDGSLYTATMRQVLRLAPGASAWTEAHAFARRVEVRALEVLGDGFVLALGDGRLIRLDAAGAVHEVPVPDGFVASNVVALPDGGFAYVAVDDFVMNEELVVAVAPDGTSRTLTARPEELRTQDLAPLADGTFVRSRPPLELVDGAGRLLTGIGRRPGLGLGDGGPPARALLEGAKELLPLADGSLVVEDRIARADAPLDAFAVRRGARLVTPPPEGKRGTAVPRILLPAGVARPVAALAPSTFATLAQGRVGYTTTVPGRAVVVVRRRGRLVARGEADVDAGAGELALSATPPRGNLRVTLTITGAGGTAVQARIGVSTGRRLTAARVRRLVRGIHVAELRAGRCVRAGAVRVRCALHDGASVSPRTCFAVLDALLRPDGLRAVMRAATFDRPSRACRALMRRA